MDSWRLCFFYLNNKISGFNLGLVSQAVIITALYAAYGAKRKELHVNSSWYKQRNNAPVCIWDHLLEHVAPSATTQRAITWCADTRFHLQHHHVNHNAQVDKINLWRSWFLQLSSFYRDFRIRVSDFFRPVSVFKINLKSSKSVHHKHRTSINCHMKPVTFVSAQ